MKFALIALAVCIAVGSVRMVLQREPTAKKMLTKTDVAGEVSESPVILETLSIPYLRSRAYSSQLGSLKEYSQKSSYTSFLTSYLSDGLRIDALLTKPNGDRPEGGWPAIVFVHGYIPPSLYQTTQKYTEYVDYLARSGFVVLKIDLRGHGNSEGTPGGAYYSSDYVIDTLSARDALSHSDFVNPNLIGLWGHSMAGNIVLRALVAEPSIPAAAIWAGAGFTYTDLQTYRIRDNSYRPLPNASQSSTRQKLFDRFGQFDPEDSFWKTVVPSNYLGDIKGSIALFHSKDDPVVNIEYSRNLNKLLDSTTIPHELHEYPTGGHNINGSSFSKAMQATIEFYKRYL